MLIWSGGFHWTRGWHKTRGTNNPQYLLLAGCRGNFYFLFNVNHTFAIRYTNIKVELVPFVLFLQIDLYEIKKKIRKNLIDFKWKLHEKKLNIFVYLLFEYIFFYFYLLGAFYFWSCFNFCMSSYFYLCSCSIDTFFYKLVKTATGHSSLFDLTCFEFSV